jgi:hypothetical protein
MQRLLGNQWVARLIDGSRSSLVQRGGDGQAAQVGTQNGQLPTTAAIAAYSGKGRDGWGQHASVFLAHEIDNQGKLEYLKIDLFQRHGDLELSLLAQASHAIFKDPTEVSGIRIEIDPATRWCDPDRSRTWTISAAAAEAALAKAREYQANQKKYFFSKYGLGVDGYNCSTFAAKIVQAAGVDASAGLIIDTPGEISIGARSPNDKFK